MYKVQCSIATDTYTLEVTLLLIILFKNCFISNILLFVILIPYSLNSTRYLKNIISFDFNVVYLLIVRLG